MLDAYIIDKLKQEKSKENQKDTREWVEISIPRHPNPANTTEETQKKEKKNSSVIIIKM